MNDPIVRRRPNYRSLDPIVSLSLPDESNGSARALASAGSRSSISSVCFLPKQCNENKDAIEDETINCSSDDEGSSDDESHKLSFRCRSLPFAEKDSKSFQSSAALRLAGHLLVSAHRDGSTLLWDLGQQRLVSQSTLLENRGPVMLLRRVDATATKSRSLLYQTRDESGTVSLHDAGRQELPSIGCVQSQSQTFCAACPCTGSPDLLALPNRQDTVAVVRDWRCHSESQPIAIIQNSTEADNNGMLTSLGFSESNTATLGRPILACGMESGKVLWYDLAMPSSPLSSASSSHSSVTHVSIASSSLQFSREPVLSLDLVPSSSSCTTPDKNTQPRHCDGVLAVAGLAAHRADFEGDSEELNGTVAVLKTIRDVNNGVSNLHSRIRCRRATCRIDNNPQSIGAGKPGVSLCRFRPDGHIFAVGGWDKRLRVFDRSESAGPLAIIRGHAGSVNAIDWSPDAAQTGILATGANDGRIHVWQCSPRGA